MTNFRCESPALEEALVRLHDLVIANGGYVNENVTFVEERGELRIISSLPGDSREKLIALSDDCLPRVNDFNITVQENRLIAEPKSYRVRGSHIAIIRAMFETFNIVNKIHTHHETNPWIALGKNPEVIDKLLEARALTPVHQERYEKYMSGMFDELLVDTFISSRKVNLVPPGDEEEITCMMPLIDYANHYCMAGVYDSSCEGGYPLSISNSRTIPGSEQSFVHYSMMDALDSYTGFGFVDVNAPFVRSVAVQHDVPGVGVIHVDARTPSIKMDELPDIVQDLRMYIPYILDLDDDVIKLSHLFIPGEYAPRALRRVLAFFIYGWKPELDMTTIQDIVLNLEELIVKKNIEYYRSFSSVLNASDFSGASSAIKKSIASLIEFQTNKIQQYQKFREHLGDQVFWPARNNS